MSAESVDDSAARATAQSVTVLDLHKLLRQQFVTMEKLRSSIKEAKEEIARLRESSTSARKAHRSAAPAATPTKTSPTVSAQSPQDTSAKVYRGFVRVMSPAPAVALDCSMTSPRAMQVSMLMSPANGSLHSPRASSADCCASAPATPSGRMSVVSSPSSAVLPSPAMFGAPTARPFCAPNGVVVPPLVFPLPSHQETEAAQQQPPFAFSRSPRQQQQMQQMQQQQQQLQQFAGFVAPTQQFCVPPQQNTVPPLQLSPRYSPRSFDSASFERPQGFGFQPYTRSVPFQAQQAQQQAPQGVQVSLLPPSSGVDLGAIASAAAAASLISPSATPALQQTPRTMQGMQPLQQTPRSLLEAQQQYQYGLQQTPRSLLEAQQQQYQQMMMQQTPRSVLESQQQQQQYQYGLQQTPRSLMPAAETPRAMQGVQLQYPQPQAPFNFTAPVLQQQQQPQAVRQQSFAPGLSIQDLLS